MSMVQKSLAKCLPLARKGINMNQTRTLVSGPATQKVTRVDKIVCGSFIFIGMLAVPLWVLTHIRTYKS